MTVDRRLAWVYLNAVAARPTAALWDLVDTVGLEEAADRIFHQRASTRVNRQTEARARVVKPAELIEKAESVGARFVCPEDPQWPADKLEPLNLPRFLADDDNANKGDALRPFGLWVRGGNLDAWTQRPCVAIVGTRNASDYGRHVADAIATACTTHGATVISGGALGIDAAAHRGTLAAHGTTGAVLACGIDSLYPASNRTLLEATKDSAGIISEYPAGTETRRYRFPDRNRIIAALADLTVVVEAGARSGALNTARHAADCHSTVLAVPGNITRGSSIGTNALIARGDALMVTSADDVTKQLGLASEAAASIADQRGASCLRHDQNPTSKTLTDGMSDYRRRVFEAVDYRGWRWPEDIALDAGLAADVVRKELGELLAEGAVQRDRGRWKRVHPHEPQQGELFSR